MGHHITSISLFRSCVDRLGARTALLPIAWSAALGTTWNLPSYQRKTLSPLSSILSPAHSRVNRLLAAQEHLSDVPGLAIENLLALCKMGLAVRYGLFCKQSVDEKLDAAAPRRYGGDVWEVEEDIAAETLYSISSDIDERDLPRGIGYYGCSLSGAALRTRFGGKTCHAEGALPGMV